MHRMNLTVPLVFVLGLLVSAAAQAEDVAHPYILWTQKEAAELRKRYEAEPWMKQSLDRIAGERWSETFVRLFRYQVLGDEKAGDAERKYLLSFVDAPLGGRDPSGMQIGKHYDNYLHALRYDVLYDSLTPQQRQGLEKTFRKFIQYELDHPYRNDRLSLLPNMQLPRLFAAHVMSVALGDEALIRKLWAAPSGFKWYFNEYLSDGGLYNEEFAKMSSLIGEMLLYCRGLDQLGLSELGYDYEGEGGATMRDYVESLFWMGYPATTVPGGMPRFERVAMGDARGGHLGLFQHANVPGYWPDGEAVGRGYDYFFAANMNGRDHRARKTEKLQYPQWYEILHAKYPDGPSGYFLAHMRKPGDEHYVPSPFWGLKPIAPDAVKPPTAPSRVFPERGFAMLRAEESPEYWKSAKPAVALQFATLYVHYTSDCFSLLGYHAFNRPIYLNRTISAGYNGGPWDFSVRGHCGVVVDGEQAQPIGRVPTRRHFAEVAKFISARGKLAEGAEGYKGRGEVRSSDQPREPFTDVYSNMDLSRSLFLTDEYLFDVYWLADKQGKPRDYHWLVHAPGVETGDRNWQESGDLQKTLMNVKPHVTQKRTWLQCEDPADSWIQIEGERRKELGEEPLDLTVVQRCILDDPGQAKLPKGWYEREVGVRLRMLGEAGTTAYHFDTPTSYRPGTPRAPRDGEVRARPETGGVSIAIARRSPQTMFVALHEPIEHATSRIGTFRRVSQTSDAVLAAVVGEQAGVNDRLMVRVGEKAGEPITLEGGGESFTFTGQGFVRITPKQVIVEGEVTTLTIRAERGTPLIVNGESVKPRWEEGNLVWQGK